jgi:hypothetical protein
MTTNTPQANSDLELMTRHGITCVSVPRYHYKTWNYAKLSDAVAQALRDEALGAGRH